MPSAAPAGTGEIPASAALIHPEEGEKAASAADLRRGEAAAVPGAKETRQGDGGAGAHPGPEAQPNTPAAAENALRGSGGETQHILAAMPSGPAAQASDPATMIFRNESEPSAADVTAQERMRSAEKNSPSGGGKPSEEADETERRHGSPPREERVLRLTDADDRASGLPRSAQAERVGSAASPAAVRPTAEGRTTPDLTKSGEARFRTEPTGSASFQEETALRTVLSAEAAAGGTGEARAAFPATTPSDAGKLAAEAASPVYLEPGEAAAPEETPRGSGENESKSAIPTPSAPRAMPVETEEAARESAEIIYREPEEAAAPGETPRDSDEIESKSAGPTPSVPRAMPAEAEEAARGSAEIIYREPEEAAASEEAPRDSGEIESKSAGPTLSAPQAMPAEAEEAARGSAAIVYREPEEAAVSEEAPRGSGEIKSKSAGPTPSVPQALPAETEEAARRSAEIVYREPEEATAPEEAPRDNDDIKSKAASPTPSVPRALPMETEEAARGSAAIIYREAKEAAAPEEAPRGSVETKSKSAGPTPSVPQAMPAEAEEAARGSAEIVYREPEEAAAPEEALRGSVETKSKSAGPTPSVPHAMPAEAEEAARRSAAIIYREPEEAAAPEEAPRDSDDIKSKVAGPTPSVQRALPVETEEAARGSAEIVYREPEETAAPEGTPRGSGAIKSDSASQMPSIPQALPVEAEEAARRSAEIVYREPEEAAASEGAPRGGSRAEQASGAPKAISATSYPADRGAEAAFPAELIHREATGAQVPAAAEKTDAAPRASAGGVPAGVGSPSEMPREMILPGENTAATRAETTETISQDYDERSAVLLSALPADTAEPTFRPAETAFPEAAAQAAAGVRMPGPAETRAADPAANTPHSPAPAKESPSARTAGEPGKAAQESIETPSEIPTAIPSEGEGLTAGGLPLVYREAAGASAPEETDRPSVGSGYAPDAEKPTTAYPASAHRGMPSAEKGRSAGTTPAAETGPENGVEDAALSEALPAVAEGPAPESAELFYRESTGTAASVSEEGREAAGPDKAVPAHAPDDRTPYGQGRSAAALPAQPGTDGTVSPVALHLRSEEGLRPAVMAQVARDIRVTAEHEGKGPLRRAPAADRAAGAARAAVAGEAKTVLAGPIQADAGNIPRAAPAPESAETPPADLIFAPTAYGAESPEEGGAARPTQKARESSRDSLPTWAKELLEQAGVTDTVQQTAAFSGQQNGASGPRQISWTAPGAQAPQRGRSVSEPAQISFKERGETEESAYRPQISEAELQRTADKVYRMIEERLRRELRRNGR